MSEEIEKNLRATRRDTGETEKLFRGKVDSGSTVCHRTDTIVTVFNVEADGKQERFTAGNV
jgi:hypothetical protein